MKIEKSLESPIKWEPATVNDVARMIRITCGDEEIILIGQAEYHHSHRGLAVYSYKIRVVTKGREI